jgi:acetylornithine deacetylase/succinyl-diaminopimelate desuccinylase-like protein
VREQARTRRSARRSRRRIARLAAEADVALVLEGARENSDIVSARKGVSDFAIGVVGRAAHAGVERPRPRDLGPRTRPSRSRRWTGAGRA